ncbi:RDD family protein [Halobacillus sp. BBL2006]|uniref:RDD family protein n=1 Tax=Halobacillus sp. BBL2006 TaxID=1543706 RepID=UPI000541DE5F|nr:RDD family protein [Halobacillus sp. BBL2006]KHE71672.1 membrane protein [Halobacillus sp. BBL2006]
MKQPVGFWKRLGAAILDVLIVSLPISLLGILLFNWDFDNTYSRNIYVLYQLIVPIVWSGYVVGKRIVGIRIVKKDGSNVGILAMFLRTIIGGLVYALTLGIGAIVSAFMVGLREDRRAIHDFIAGTYVTEALPNEMD